jgi:hypothetical protein
LIFSSTHNNSESRQQNFVKLIFKGQHELNLGPSQVPTSFFNWFTDRRPETTGLAIQALKATHQLGITLNWDEGNDGKIQLNGKSSNSLKKVLQEIQENAMRRH